MGYVKVAYRKIFYQLDHYSELPNGWDEFVKKQEQYHNLIIKSSKNKCHCTNCNYDFYSKKKVNEEAKCPNCHNKYLIKRSNLRYYDFKDYLSILNIVNNTFVIRYFELKTIIDAKHNHNSSVVEFAREILTNNWYRDVYINERVSKNQCHIYIYHQNGYYIDETKWRQYTRNYSLIDYSIVFPNNLKKLFKNTKFKYSCIWDIAKNSTYIDLLDLLKNNDDYALNRIERLSKMKLYNLALRAKEFSCNGTFQKIFGVSKDFYSFMTRYNITYTQLEILRLLKEKDIKKIRYLEKFISYSDNTEDLKEISKYISLNRFIKYSKMHHRHVKTYLYKDYLRFAKYCGLDLKNNKYAFPKNLREEHDKLEKQYEMRNKKEVRKGIIKRGRELSVNNYKNNQFFIKPARTLKELLDESKQQNHCVRTYAEKYANGECDIYFMRKTNNRMKSLVTIEVKNNKVIQSRTKNNNTTNKEQQKFIKQWENIVLQKVV